jgi:hypothetical protein
MSTFLKLLTTSVVQINNNDLNTLLNVRSYSTPSAPRDTMTNGDLPEDEYMAIAQNVKNFMDSQDKAPEYALARL